MRKEKNNSYYVNISFTAHCANNKRKCKSTYGHVNSQKYSTQISVLRQLLLVVVCLYSKNVYRLEQRCLTPECAQTAACLVCYPPCFYRLFPFDLFNSALLLKMRIAQLEKRNENGINTAEKVLMS